MDKFRNKYTIRSTRLEKHDYSQSGMYFVTICTKRRDAQFGRLYTFGEIENGKMALSDIGKIAKEYWQEIPKHFPFVNLDEYIVMPNHIHGIVEIIKNDQKNVETPNLGVSTDANMYWKSGCLGVIINQYKRICTIKINKKFPNAGFQWQSRFYDHIIRDEISLNKIREYIQTNPQMWERDRNNLGDVFM